MNINYRYLLKNIVGAKSAAPGEEPLQLLYVGRWPAELLEAAKGFAVVVDLILPYRMPYFTAAATAPAGTAVGEVRFVSGYLSKDSLFRGWTTGRFDAIYIEDEWMLPTSECLPFLYRCLGDPGVAVLMGGDQFRLETQLKTLGAASDSMRLMTTPCYQDPDRPLMKTSYDHPWWYHCRTERIRSPFHTNSVDDVRRILGKSALTTESALPS